jgi:hypothetical protein
VLDWELDAAGNLQWAIVHSRSQPRSGPDSERDTVTEQWEYLTRETITTYAISYPANKKPHDDQEVGKFGEPVPHRFGRVPLICIQLPPSLWIASRLELPQLAHLRTLNAQAWSINTTCYAMPVNKVNDPENFTKQTQGAGFGIVIGVDESWGWEAPPSAHFDALDTAVTAHKDEIYRIAHQMALGVENNAAAVGRSADSKMQDGQATRVVLVAFAKKVREEIARCFDSISAMRGDAYTWTVSGLDEFAATDLQGFLDVMAKIQEVGGIPSRTAMVLLKTRLAESALAEIDQATRATVRTEIAANTPEPGTELDDELRRMHAMASGFNETKPGDIAAEE